MMRHHSSNTQVVLNDEDKQAKASKKEHIAIIMKDLKLKPIKKVTFTEDTVDNEHMNKRKSKSN